MRGWEFVVVVVVVYELINRNVEQAERKDSRIKTRERSKKYIFEKSYVCAMHAVHVCVCVCVRGRDDFYYFFIPFFRRSVAAANDTYAARALQYDTAARTDGRTGIEFRIFFFRTVHECVLCFFTVSSNHLPSYCL